MAAGGATRHIPTNKNERTNDKPTPVGLLDITLFKQQHAGAAQHLPVPFAILAMMPPYRARRATVRAVPDFRLLLSFDQHLLFSGDVIFGDIPTALSGPHIICIDTIAGTNEDGDALSISSSTSPF